MKKVLTVTLTLALVLVLLASCGTDAPKKTGATLNGVDISEYTIIYSAKEPDYNKNAAEYLQARILEVTGAELPILTDAIHAQAHEILVGETSRPLSSVLDADTELLEFAMLSDSTSVAMEGDYFVIAAAAYYFVNTYITDAKFASTVPDTVTVNAPIVKKPDNFIFLIGDGMGVYQTKLFEYTAIPTGATTDGEDLFYGYLLPYRAEVKTASLSEGATDSAASGTALATGYKTYNKHIGIDKDKNDVMSLTELANSLGKATAVMSTEDMDGATPAAFSAHADNRNDSLAITESQKLLKDTILKTVTNSYSNKVTTGMISEVLGQLDKDENGFFVMYEEAHIDKNCHDNRLDVTFKALLRFNQAIGQFMEYAFYHPNTLVLITADHETGDLRPEGDALQYHSDVHSEANVLLFAYGMGAELFDGLTIENVQIPKTIAKMWGNADFGDTSSPYPPLG